MNARDRSGIARKVADALVSGGIIFGCLGIGELLARFISKAGLSAIPGSVLGMVLLFLLLHYKLIPIERVTRAADFFLEYLGLFFVPAGVGLMAHWHALKENWIVVVLAITVGTLIVLWVVGNITQRLQSPDDCRDE